MFYYVFRIIVIRIHLHLTEGGEENKHDLLSVMNFECTLDGCLSNKFNFMIVESAFFGI